MTNSISKFICDVKKSTVKITHEKIENLKR